MGEPQALSDKGNEDLPSSEDVRRGWRRLMGRGFEDYVFGTYSTQRNTHKHCPQTKQCHVWHNTIIYTLSLHLPVHAGHIGNAGI